MSRLTALRRPLWTLRLWRANRIAEQRAAQQLAADLARHRHDDLLTGLREANHG